jgi:Holliday junction resolvase
MNIEGPLEKEVLRLLQEIPGVTAEPMAATGHRPDVVIRAGDVTHVVEVKAQRVTNAADARQLVEYARHLPKGTHLLLVARTTTEEARRILEEQAVGVIDTQGNMRVELPGLFLWTEGRPGPAAREQNDQPPVKLTGKAGIAAQALLLEPQRRWQVHDLAKAADVSVGLAHRVLARLEREQLVEVEGVGPKRTRRVEHPTALLDLWAEEMRDRRIKQVRAFRLARDPRAQAKTLSRGLAEAKIEHAVTGPAGAARQAPFITAIPVTDIWIADTVALADAAAAIRADVVQEGHNIILRQAAGDGPLAFRTKVDDVWTANPFRLFLDLRQDPRRGREQADRLRAGVIGF